MQRQRGELVPIGDALSGMGGPVAAIRDATAVRFWSKDLRAFVGASSDVHVATFADRKVSA